MPLNVCPGCKEVVLSFGDESSIKCSKCETSFEISNSINDKEDNNEDME